MRTSRRRRLEPFQENRPAHPFQHPRSSNATNTLAHDSGSKRSFMRNLRRHSDSRIREPSVPRTGRKRQHKALARKRVVLNQPPLHPLRRYPSWIAFDDIALSLKSLEEPASCCHFLPLHVEKKDMLRSIAGVRRLSNMSTSQTDHLGPAIASSPPQALCRLLA
jgi:hypothetical protein